MNSNPVAATVATILAAAPVHGKTLTIGIDESASSPVLTSPEFADSAATFLAQKIAALEPGDVVTVRPLGDLTTATTMAARSFQIDRRNRADMMARKIAGYVKQLPAQKLPGQRATNLISFYQSGGFACDNGGQVIVVTDGVESSTEISERQLLAGKALPRPEKDRLAGCAVTMFGVGESLNGDITPKQKRTLRAAWKAWLTAAGARFIDP